MTTRGRRRLLALALGLILVVGVFMGGNAWAVSQGFGAGLVMDDLSVPPEVGWRWLPDQHLSSPLGFPIDINNYGMRDPVDIAEAKPAGVFRVLCIGDSFTYGLQVSFEETYAQKLEEALAAALPGRTVEVWNCGVNGWNSCQEAGWLDHYGLPLQPDLVVVGFVMNDTLPITDSMMPGSFPGRTWMLHFPVYQWLRHKVVQQQRLDSTSPEAVKLKQFIKQYQGQIELSPSSSDTARRLWDDALACLGRFVDSCSGHKLPCALVVFPTLPQMKHSSPQPEAQKVLTEFAKGKPCVFVDLLPRYAIAGEPALLASDKAHPSPIGHAIAAEEIMRALKRAGTLPGATDATGGGH